jgi:hypothetical protein
MMIDVEFVITDTAGLFVFKERPQDAGISRVARVHPLPGRATRARITGVWASA